MPRLYTQNNLRVAELSAAWGLPSEKKAQYTGKVLWVSFNRQQIDLPVVRLSPDLAIAWFEPRRMIIAENASTDMAGLITGLKEKPDWLVTPASSKSGPMIEMVHAKAQLLTGKMEMGLMTIPGGNGEAFGRVFKTAAPAEIGVSQMNYEGQDFTVVTYLPVTGMATNSLKHLWASEAQLAQISGEAIIVDDVVTTRATDIAVRKMLEIGNVRNMGIMTVTAVCEGPDHINDSDLRSVIKMPEFSVV